MIITFIQPLAVGFVLLGLVAGSGCTHSGGDVAKPAATPDPGAAGRALAGDLLGALKLVRQEYGNAVAVAGSTVIDATEYAETELFAEQAEQKLAAWRAAGGIDDAGRAEKLAQHVAKVRADVASKAAPATVADDAGAAIAIVQEAMAGAMPESIRGVVLATTTADQRIQSEEVVGDYRVGVYSDRAQAIFTRSGETLAAEAASPAGAVYLAVVLRERRTKRPLSAAEVDVVLEGQGRRVEAHLAELWGEIHQYGANVELPDDGPVTITVRVSPPAYARHGDMLNTFVAPVTATVQAHVRERALAFDAKPVTATDPDYSIGDDLLQAIAEAGELHNVGPYRVGLILEGPEPIWLWKDGKPALEAVAPDATNHIEVVLVDRESGQLVPRASIDLVFLATGAQVGTTTLVPLLSVFSHYGKTLKLPEGTTSVRIHVHPPAIGALGRPRLGDPADVELPLPSKRSED
jgi:hypothetical protein